MLCIVKVKVTALCKIKPLEKLDNSTNVEESVDYQSASVAMSKIRFERVDHLTTLGVFTEPQDV